MIAAQARCSYLGRETLPMPQRAFQRNASNISQLTRGQLQVLTRADTRGAYLA
jgi:hypothetical protein